MKPWHPTRQRDRRELLFERYRARMGSCVDRDAGWHGVDREQGFREKVWHCFPLLAGSSAYVDLANGILASVDLKPCHFTPVSFLELIHRHGDRLEPRVRQRMLEYVRESLPLAASPRFHFTMYNDNFAAMACFALIVGGETLGEEGAVAAGLGKLEELAELFRRRGTIMEYGSPTYTPVNTHVLAGLAAHAANTEARRLALACEERMWAEIASHWHGPSGHLAGPYSRAYWTDSVGHPHLMSGLLWLVFGEAIFVNPVADLLPPRDRQVIHIGLETLMLPNIAWVASGDCHCPDYLARMLLAKPFPFEVSATSESLPSLIRGYRTWRDGRREAFDNPREYPGFAGPNTAWLAGDFSLGAGFSGYHDGALSETFYLTWRRRRPARRLEDTGVALSRYIFNDRRPERQNYYSVFDSVHGPEGFRDEGRKWGLQKGPCALYAYRPKPFEAHEVSSMKLSVIFPCHFAWVDEIWLGARRIALPPASAETGDSSAASANLGESEEPCPVFVRDGPVFMAFVPLALTSHGRHAAVRLERWTNYLAVSFYNYEGPARSFTVEEMLLTSSGFVVHVASDRDFPGFPAFCARAAEGKVSDETTESEGGHTRWIRYRHPDADLRFAFSPASEGILVAAIDGRPRAEPVFQATGLDQRRLPFLGRR